MTKNVLTRASANFPGGAICRKDAGSGSPLKVTHFCCSGSMCCETSSGWSIQDLDCPRWPWLDLSIDPVMDHGATL